MIRVAVWILNAWALAPLGLGPAPTPAPAQHNEVRHRTVGSDLEPFRSDFNRFSDQVRAVLLVGPT